MSQEDCDLISVISTSRENTANLQLEGAKAGQNTSTTEDNKQITVDTISSTSSNSASPVPSSPSSFGDSPTFLALSRLPPLPHSSASSAFSAGDNSIEPQEVQQRLVSPPRESVINNMYSTFNSGNNSGWNRTTSQDRHYDQGGPGQSNGNNSTTSGAYQSQDQYNANGRPLSPDGWPVRKTEIRGYEEPIPDFLSTYLQKTTQVPVQGNTTGWSTSRSDVSNATAVAASATPLPQSEIGKSQQAPGFEASHQSAQAHDDIIAHRGENGWRTSTPKPLQTSSEVTTLPLQATDTTRATDAPPSQNTPAADGWTVRQQDSVSSLALPKQAQEPQQLAPVVTQARLPSPTNIASTLDKPSNNEAWVLQSVEDVINNNWTSTTRRSRVARRVQSPAYIGTPAGSGLQPRTQTHRSVSGSSYIDDNSIRPSESASNVGFASQATSQAFSNKPAFAAKPMRQFQGEKDDDIGSDNSSGSLHDNPNVLAGGWQSSPPVNSGRVPAPGRMSGHHQQPTNGHGAETSREQGQPPLSSWSSNQPPQGSWQQTQRTDGNRAALTAPTPRRWDSSSQQLVGDLERAATPRGAFLPPSVTSHGRSVSSAAPGSMSIRGASKYHAETIMLKDELDKIRSQLASYETKLLNVSNIPDQPDFDSELQEVRSENEDLRKRINALENDRSELRGVLQHALKLLA